MGRILDPVWARWIVAVGAGVLVALLAAPRRAWATEPPRVLFVTSARADKAEGVTDALLDRIDSAIETGARVSIAKTHEKKDGDKDDGNPRYWKVITHRRIYNQQRSTVVKPLEDLAVQAGRDLGRQIDSARQTIKKSKVDVLEVLITRRLAGELRVDLELYELQEVKQGTREREGMKLLAVKSVGGCGESENDVLERLRQAAEQLKPLDENKAPEVVITVRPSGPVMVGTEVTLDGCRSAHPDFDAMVWTWKQVSGPSGSCSSTEGREACVIPSSGYGGRSLRFTPERDGEYEIELEVRTVLGGSTKAKATRKATIRAHGRPHAVAGENRIVEDVKKPVQLDSRGSTPAPERSSYRWRQIAGPHVALSADPSCRDAGQPEAGARGCACFKCSFVGAYEGLASGLYTFELEVESGPGSAPARDRAQVSVLVAPPPRARIGAADDVNAEINQPLKLDAGTSFDAIDSSPVFQWSVYEALGDGRCPEGPACGASIRDARGRAATFIAHRLGTYTVRLRVAARRTLPGQELWAYDQDTITVHVRRPQIMPFAGISSHLRLGGDGAHTFIAPTVGLLLTPFTVDSLARLSLRLTQSLARISLIKNIPSEPGGGISAELGVWVWEPSGFDRIELNLHAGIAARAIESVNELGPVGGGTFSFRLGFGLRVLLDVAYQFVIEKKADFALVPKLVISRRYHDPQFAVSLAYGF